MSVSTCLLRKEVGMEQVEQRARVVVVVAAVVVTVGEREGGEGCLEVGRGGR